MSDLQCPYCGAEHEVRHDDGYGYEEHHPHEMECDECGKTFVFHTTVVLYYEARKADCLNGAPHDYRLVRRWPLKWSVMGCRVCDHNRRITDREYIAIGMTECGRNHV